MWNYSSYVQNVFICSPVVISFLLPCPYAVYMYCSKVMRWLGYGNKTGRYVDACGMRCPDACWYGLGSIDIWYPGMR